MHDDPHRSIHVTMSGPTPRTHKIAVRCREAWRGFWRHRAEEYRAAVAFVDHHPAPLGVTVVVLAAAAMIGIPWYLSVRSDEADARECMADCELLGRGIGILRYECFCVSTTGESVARDDLLRGSEARR